MKQTFDAVAARRGKFFSAHAVAYTLLGATAIGAAILLGWRNTCSRTSFQARACAYETHTLLSAGQFTAAGFRQSCFLPFDAPDDFSQPLHYWIYTHIPPFSEVFFGALHAWGVNSTHGLRWFSIALNVAALIVLFAAMSMLKDRAFALLTVWAVVLNPLFWMRAHGLYEYAFGLPHQALLLLGLAIYARTRRTLGVALAFIGAFWQGACTVFYQLETYFIILGFFFTIGRRDRRRDQRAYFLVALAGPLSFAAHFVQIALADGSVVRAFTDLFDSYQQKSVAIGPHVRYFAAYHKYHSFGSYLLDIARAIGQAVGVRPHFLLAVALTFATLGGALARRDDATARADLVRVAFLFVGSSLWFFVMPEVALADIGPGVYSLTLWLALSIAVPLYGAGAAARRVIRDKTLWAAPLVVAYGCLALLLWWSRLPELKDYLSEERRFLAEGPETNAVEESLWAVGPSAGLRGQQWLTLFGLHAPDSVKYGRRQCGENDAPPCADAVQGLRFFFWRDVTLRAPAIQLTCARPGATRVAFYRVGMDESKGRLLGETRAPQFAGGRLEIPLSAPAAGRVFTLEIGPEACGSYVIERVRLQ